MKTITAYIGPIYKIVWFLYALATAGELLGYNNSLILDSGYEASIPMTALVVIWAVKAILIPWLLMISVRWVYRRNQAKAK